LGKNQKRYLLFQYCGSSLFWVLSFQISIDIELWSLLKFYVKGFVVDRSTVLFYLILLIISICNSVLKMFYFHITPPPFICFFLLFLSVFLIFWNISVKKNYVKVIFVKLKQILYTSLNLYFCNQLLICSQESFSIFYFRNKTSQILSNIINIVKDCSKLQLLIYIFLRVALPFSKQHQLHFFHIYFCNNSI